MPKKSTFFSDRHRAVIYADFKANFGELSFDITREFYKKVRSSLRSRATADSMPTDDRDIPRAYAVPGFAANDTTPRVIHHHHHDSGIPSWLFWWMLCRSNNAPAPQQRREEQRDSNFGAWMGAVIIAGIVALPAIAGIYYLLSELVNNLERLYYNEGYLQAGLGLANIAGSLAIGTLLTNTLLASCH